MNNPLENLRQLTEAVRMAGADIAPTYIEYVQLAFAIANDCGEAGRNDFLSLCSLSSKYDEKNAQALFSNALHADKEDIHLGTMFHLAGQCGVKISGSAGSHKAGTMGTAGTAPDFPHTCARYNKVENEENETGKKKHEEEEKEMKAKLYEAMVKFGVDKFESDVLNLTLVKPTNATSIDSTKLKKKYPDIASECSKTTAKAGYVKITLKDGGADGKG